MNMAKSSVPFTVWYSFPEVPIHLIYDIEGEFILIIIVSSRVFSFELHVEFILLNEYIQLCPQKISFKLEFELKCSFKMFVYI